MDTEFKVPTFEPKLKVITKKDKISTDDVVEPKEIGVAASVTAPKEPESAKVESELVKNLPKFPYVEPKWSKTPASDLMYSFEVLKGGQIVENVENLQQKAFWTMGKFQTNDIVMAHPTISRYHAVLQYRPEVTSQDDSSDSSDDEENGSDSNKPTVDKGWYLYDLNSTHGTFVNKMKVPPKTYIRIRVGYMLKFGASTRNYILQGPGFDEEAESELTITEMKELKLKKQQEQQDKLMEEEKRKEEEEKRKEAEGISWGMTDDADEETDLSHNPFATTNNEDLFLQDPKKTLRGYFEREGLNLDYKVDELSSGTYLCKVELPITDSMGRGITAEFTHKGKKKECVVQCALEACRILDRNGLLRQANHEPRKRKIESSDDDDDEFYDRTAEAEEKRRRKAGTEENVSLSYEQLIEEEKKLQSQLSGTEKRIEKYQQLEKATKEKEAMDVDDLDDFMSGLSNEKKMDKADVRKCRFELQRIKSDIQKMQRLINIARPIDLPPLKIDKIVSDASQNKKSLPLFGKKKTFGFDKLKQQVSSKKPALSSENNVNQGESIEEFDEDEDDSKATQKKSTIPKKEVISDVQRTASSTVDTSNTAKHSDEIINASVSDSADKPSPNEIKAKSENIQVEEKSPMPKEMSSHRKIDSKSQLAAEEPNVESGLSSRVSNKTKNKNRQRNKMRHQIDVDETEEDTSPQKYSGWIPPENQSGDGMTSLNSKYGY